MKGSSMGIFKKLRSSVVIFIHDLIMVSIAWMGAYWLRFNLSDIPVLEFQTSLFWLPIAILLQGLLFRLFGLYRGVWRFASIPDLICIGKAVGFGAASIAFCAFLYDRLQGVPRSVVPLYALLLLLLLCGPRFFYRMLKDRGAPSGAGRKALIVGAGQAGEMLVRDLLRERNVEFRPVAFVDDALSKKGREIQGIRVLGNSESIPEWIEKLDIEIILIAVPSASEKEIRRIVEICENTESPFLILPSVQEALSAHPSRSLRDVSIEDLLGRLPIKLDRSAIGEHLKGKRILVTGGGGSIGSQLCKQISEFSIECLMVFDHCEFNLYKLECDLAGSCLNLKPVLGDVTDALAIERLIALHQPDIIFHAAAYKHVPMLEGQVRAAIRNNVIGTRIVAQAAVKAKVKEFVLISTDKAVNPSNIMGASKRAAEMLVQGLSETAETRFITVRFGNVLDSAGSVVPLFRNQIAKGGPLTVTHADITRYFMTIPEACQLIMQAATVGKGGEVFVLDMGEPVKLSYLAEQMIRLSGKRPGIDIFIEYIGLRPGEKMYEELFHDQERPAPTGHPKLLLAKSRSLDLIKLKTLLDELETACSDFDEDRIEPLLSALVPEYRSANG